MKTKLRIQNRLNFILLEMLIISLIFELVFNISKLTLFEFFINNSLIVVGASLVIKSKLFKSDNSLWFGLILIIYGLFGWLNSWGVIIEPWVYVLAVVPVSIVVGTIFQGNVLYKMATMFLFLSIAVYFIEKIEILYFITMLIFLALGGFFFQKLIPIRKKG